VAGSRRAEESRERTFIAIDPDPPPFLILNLMKDFLVQATARPRGQRGRDLREWRSQTLYRCYERSAAGVAQVTERAAFPGAIEFREGHRYVLCRPRPADPPAPAELVELMTAFRQDVDADAQPGENLHDQTLSAIAGIAGRALTVFAM
jgi:hypothetical protein